jgi:hypothetical protein
MVDKRGELSGVCADIEDVCDSIGKEPLQISRESLCG